MLEANYAQAQSAKTNFQGLQPNQPLDTQIQSPIHGSLHELQCALEAMYCSIEKLQTRLSPVTFYSPECIEKAPQDIGGGCDIWQDIERKTRNVSEMRKRIEGIIQALQV